MVLSTISINSYSSLRGDQASWGGAMMPVLVEIFRSIMEEFNSVVGVIPKRSLSIQPDQDLGHPMCCKNGKNYIIYLSARENYWSKYTYQFAHEYCHYLIDGPLDGKFETTFWFEESICELASMFFIQRVTSRWQSWFPVLIPGSPLSGRDDALLRLKQFAPKNSSYLDDLLKKNAPIDTPLYEWIAKTISTLSEPVYHRDMYNQIATVLYGVFTKYPDLWKVIPSLRRPSLEEYVDFNTYIITFLNRMGKIGAEHLPVLVECLIGPLNERI